MRSEVLGQLYHTGYLDVSILENLLQIIEPETHPLGYSLSCIPTEEHISFGHVHQQPEDVGCQVLDLIHHQELYFL